MNVFVLTAGRSGSTTFIAACRHISNYTCAHESRVRLIGPQRLAYPERHIEADNRLVWYLGRLDAVYGDRARYVHLVREPEACAASFARRADFGIMQAWREGVLLGGEAGETAHALALDYLDTVAANIALFLRDKTQVMTFRLERAREDFLDFWDWIGAEGDQAAALAEWERHYNASARA
jgi:hypothetical protein